MTYTEDAAAAHAWAALGGRGQLVQRVCFEGVGTVLPSRLPVRELARACVGVSSLAAAELLALRNRVPVPAVRVNEAAVATAFVSERHLRIDGRAPTPFAPLSGFWRTADGWVRTHANYPHHRARLLSALGIADTGHDQALVGMLSKELASRPAREVQETVYAAGGLAVAVASAPAAAGPSLVETRRVGQSSPRLLAPAAVPAQGGWVPTCCAWTPRSSPKTRMPTPTPVWVNAPPCWISPAPVTGTFSRGFSARQTSW